MAKIIVRMYEKEIKDYEIDLANALHHISEMVRDGYTSGIDCGYLIRSWELS